MVKSFRERFDDFLLTLSGLVLCFIAIVIFFGFVASVIYGFQKSSVTINSNEWACTESIRVKKNSPMLVGKVVVTQTKIIDECVNYKKQGQ